MFRLWDLTWRLFYILIEFAWLVTLHYLVLFLSHFCECFLFTLYLAFSSSLQQWLSSWNLRNILNLHCLIAIITARLISLVPVSALWLALCCHCSCFLSPSRLPLWFGGCQSLIPAGQLATSRWVAVLLFLTLRALKLFNSLSVVNLPCWHDFRLLLLLFMLTFSQIIVVLQNLVVSQLIKSVGSIKVVCDFCLLKFLTHNLLVERN